MKNEENLLEGMPAAKKPRKRVVKKHHTTKNVPVETSVRRQLSEEIGDSELTRDQKGMLLQKYGVTAPRIDRQVKRPYWMGVSEWKRRQNEWFRATKGLVPAQQRPKYRSQNSQQRPGTLKFKRPQAPRFQQARPQGTRAFHRNSGPMRMANPQS